MKRILSLIALCCCCGFAATPDETETLACDGFFPEYSMPHRLIMRLGDTSPGAFQELLIILKDDTRKHCWLNATWMIGVLSPDSDIKPLSDFIDRGNGEIDRDELLAKGNAVLAIGLLADGGNEAAFSYLNAVIERRREKKSSFAWTPPKAEADDMNRFLAFKAVNALGFSGKPRAKSILQQYAEDSDWQFRRAVKEALLMNAKINQLGNGSAFDW